MFNMTSFELIVSLAIILIAMSIFMAFMFYVMQKKRGSYYNEEKRLIELDMLRHNLEAQIYNLNDRLTKTSSRFQDIYQLQLDGNSLTEKSDFHGIKMNDFLKNAGLKQSDLKEEDFVFVLTPFHNDYTEVYNTIKMICDKTDIRCIRGDEQNFKGDIFPHVLKNIVQARIVIANLSGRNPNVLYELGIAHALDKTTILISHFLDDLPVDIKSKRIVTYKNVRDLESALPFEILKAIKITIQP